MSTDNLEIVIDFQPRDKTTTNKIKETFDGLDIIESSGFSGTELVTVIISATVLAMDKILNFYIQNRKTLKATSIKIGKDEVELSGFTDEEIKKIIEDGSIAKIREQMK